MSEEKSNLEVAVQLFGERSKLKKDQPHEFKKRERVTMAALTDEILRFGIDRNTGLDLTHRHKSVIFEGDVLDQLLQNNALSREDKQFRPLRERADTTL